MPKQLTPQYPPIPLDEGRIADWLEATRSSLTKSSLKGIRSQFVFICEKAGLSSECLGGIVSNKVKAILEEVLEVVDRLRQVSSSHR